MSLLPVNLRALGRLLEFARPDRTPDRTARHARPGSNEAPRGFGTKLYSGIVGSGCP